MNCEVQTRGPQADFLLDAATREVVDKPFDRATVELCEQRADVVVLSADLAQYTDLFTLPKARPHQFIQVGMAEQNLLGIAGGLAKTGLVPVAVTFAVYASRRAFDQLAMCMGSGANSRGVVVGFTPGITSPARVHHQSLEDVAMMRALPGGCVIDPADATEFVAALRAAVDHRGVVFLRGQRGAVPRLFDPEHYRFRIGDVYTLRRQAGTGIVATGAATQWALEASALLDEAGVEHGILHVPTLKPVDTEAIAAFARGRSNLVTIENHNINGGLGSLVAEVLAERAAPTKLRRLGVPDCWAPGGSLANIRRTLKLDASGIAETVRSLT